MNFRRSFAGAVLTAILATIAVTPARPQGKVVSVKGYVLDSACAFFKKPNKPVRAECALACAKAGSPLVILADDGTIYWPISDSVPATGQNPRLMKFAGQRVRASGKVIEKGGSHGLVIEKIEAEAAGK